MMKLGKNTLYFFLVMSFSKSAVSQEYGIENPDSLYKLYQIRSEYVYVYRFTKDKIADSTIVLTKLYDTSGRLVKRYNFDHNNKDLLKSTELYEYNREGILSKKIVGDSILGFSRITEYAYQKQGKLTESVSYINNKDERGEFSLYEYDKNGNLEMVSVKIGRSGTYVLRLRHEYENNRLKKTTQYDVYGSQESYIDYTYEKDGKLEKKYLQLKGQQGMTTNFKYDANGRCIEQKIVYNIYGGNPMSEFMISVSPLGTPTIEKYLYYPEGLCFERKFLFSHETIMVRAYYSTEYPIDLQ